jgi:hypothetical protein
MRVIAAVNASHWEPRVFSDFSRMVCCGCDAFLHGVIESDGGGLHGLLSKCSVNAASLCYPCKLQVFKSAWVGAQGGGLSLSSR